jgi:trigger factor
MSEATATTNWQIEVTDAGPARKRISITVSAEAIAEKLGDSLSSLQTDAALPGFRKGRAPRQLLEKRFGSEMRSEARNELIGEAYQAALKENDLNPIGEPENGDEGDIPEIELGKPLKATLEVDVIPTIDLPEASSLKIQKPVIDVTDEHVETELQRQCQRNGGSEMLTDGFVAGDRLLGAGTLTRDGEEDPFFTHDQVLAVLPEDGPTQVLGLFFDDFQAEVAKASVGDTITATAIGPEGHEREDIRGKTLMLSLTLNQAERITPCTTEELIEQFSLPSQEILTDHIRTALEQRRDEEVASVMRDQAVDQICKAVSIELPERVTAQQASRDMERSRLEMMYRGDMSEEEIEDRLAELRTDSETRANERLKMFFVLQAMATRSEIQVSEQEINSRIHHMAQQRGVRPDQLRTELAQSGQLTQVAGQIRDHKAADAAVADATITEIPLEEWQKLQGGDSAASKAKTAKSTGKKKTTKKSGSKKTASKKSTTKKSTSKKTTKKTSKKS